ncbi:MAG: hypothetical protein Q9202_001943 [Teloschistes flavicans]
MPCRRSFLTEAERDQDRRVQTRARAARYRARKRLARDAAFPTATGSEENPHVIQDPEISSQRHMGQESSTMVNRNGADHLLVPVETPDGDFLSKLEEQNEQPLQEAQSSIPEAHIDTAEVNGDSDGWSDYTKDGSESVSVRDNFETQGISQEELDLWTKKAPEDQKLSSALASPQKPMLEASHSALQTHDGLAARILAKLVAKDANREGGDLKLAQQINPQLSHMMMSREKSDTCRSDPANEGDNRFAAQMLAGLITDANKQRVDPKVSKNINHFVRRHDFFREQSLGQYTALQRRAFVRDVYDYARALQLSKIQARQATINARALCGEEAYNSDDSKLDEEEVDDCASFLTRQHTGTLPPFLALPAPLFENGSEAEQNTKTNRKHEEETSGNPSSKRRKTSNEVPRNLQDTSSTGLEEVLMWKGEAPSTTKQQNAAKGMKKHSKKNGQTQLPASSTQHATECATLQAPVLQQQSGSKPGASVLAFRGNEKTKSQEKNAEPGSKDDTDASINRALRRYENGQLSIDDLKFLTCHMNSDRVELLAFVEEMQQLFGPFYGNMEAVFPSATPNWVKAVARVNHEAKKRQPRASHNADSDIENRAHDEYLKAQARELRQHSIQHIPPILRLRGGLGRGVEDGLDQLGPPDSNEPRNLVSSDSGAVSAQDTAVPGHSRLTSNAPLTTPVKSQTSSTDSSPLSSAPSNPRTPTPIRIVIQEEVNNEDDSPLSSAPSDPSTPTPDHTILKTEAECKPETKQSTKRKRGTTISASGLTPSKRQSSSKTSPYFLPSPKPPREQVSCIPFPPLSSTSFGLVQESLAFNPFHLLIAVIFLNKTRGAVAMPVFYTFIARFPDPASLANASQTEVVTYFQNLGLQNQRAGKCIKLAQAWMVHPPERGKRWRRLHYPMMGDGKDIKTTDEPIADESEDQRVAWEIGHLPGIGAYGIDSWRIFCRDELRGRGSHALPPLADGADEDAGKGMEDEEMAREWTRVLPMDKELRAYLRWRWLRMGWEWDPRTGERKRAGREKVEDAAGGGVIYEEGKGDTGSMVVERGRKEEEIG